MYVIPKKGLRIIERNPFSLLSDILREHGELEGDLLPVIKRGKGPYIYDYDENRFVDFFLAQGSLTLGHAPPGITRVMKSWLGRGYSAGYQAASHALLAKKLFALLFNRATHTDKGYRWLFYDSPYEAFYSLFSLLELAGYTGRCAYLADGRGISRYARVWSEKIPPFTGSRKERASVSCVIWRPESEGKIIHTVRELGKMNAVIVSDESGIESYLHLCSARNLLDSVQVRIFGNWLASGYSFGCIVAGNSFLSRLKAGMNRERFERLLLHAGFPPLYKIKAVIASAIHMEDFGGIEGLIEKNRLFFSLLGDRYFLLRGGLIYLREREKLRPGYRELHRNLLREGIFFPLSCNDPVCTSFTHSETLLKRSATKINSLFDAFYR
jgi:hypothetical protein